MINQVRLPVKRSSVEIELLPWGYDLRTGVATLRAIEESPQPQPHGVQFGEGLGKPSQESDSKLPGLGGSKPLLHLLLPLFVLSQIHPQGAGSFQNGLPRIQREIQQLQRPSDEFRISLHAGLNHARATRQAA